VNFYCEQAQKVDAILRECGPTDKARAALLLYLLGRASHLAVDLLEPNVASEIVAVRRWAIETLDSRCGTRG
jgi:hypothetical protein